MAKREPVPIRIFNMNESYGGGGTFFNDGTYRITKARFVMFNFNKEGGDEACCLQLTLQPLDGSGRDNGEPVVQHWPLEKRGDGNYEPINKGLCVGSIGEYPTIWKLSDFAIFMQHLQKAEFDMDKYEEDGEINVLEGLVAEFGKYTKPSGPNAPVAVDDEGKPKRAAQPYQVVVITHIPKAGKGMGAAKAKEVAAGKTNGKAAAEPATNGSFDAEGKLAEYLAANVFTDDYADKGIKVMQARMGITKWMSKQDADVEDTKKVLAVFNDKKQMGPILEAAGWLQDGDTFKKAAEE